MWANTVWGLFGFAFACLLGRLGVSDPFTKTMLLYATWGFVVLGFLVLAFPGVRRVLHRAYRKTPIQIIFDPRNPARRFWSLENAPHPTDASRHVPYFETRLEIRNRSNKTVRNVRVSVAMIGPIPTRPALCPSIHRERQPSTLIRAVLN